MMLNEPTAALRVISATLKDDTGQPLALNHVFGANDLKIILPSGAIANASALPVAVAGALPGTFNIQVAQSELQALGNNRWQLSGAGLSNWEWIETVGNENLTVSGLLAAIIAPNSPWPELKTLGQLLLVWMAWLAGDATGFPFAVAQSLSFQKVDGSGDVALAGTIANGARTTTTADGS